MLPLVVFRRAFCLMSHLGLEVLRGLAATRLDHLNHVGAPQGALSSSLSSTRVLWMARMTTMVAVLLLWFAGELERFALGEPLESEPLSEAEEEQKQEVDPPSKDSASGLVSSHRGEPMRCRWCRQEVMCEPNGEVFDLNHEPHGCGLHQVKTHRRRSDKNGCPSHNGAPQKPPGEGQA